MQNDLVASCWFSYLLVFLRTVLLFPSVHAGLLLLIGQLSDGAATPVVGFLSDRTLSAFGKRRLWIVVGSVVVLLSFPPHLPRAAAAAAVADVAGAVLRRLHRPCSSSPGHPCRCRISRSCRELTRDNDERVLLNSLRSICTILANLTVFLLAFAILHAKDTGALGPADLPAFFSLALMVVAIGALFSVVFVLGVPEPAPRAKKVGQRRRGVVPLVPAPVVLPDGRHLHVHAPHGQRQPDVHGTIDAPRSDCPPPPPMRRVLSDCAVCVCVWVWWWVWVWVCGCGVSRCSCW